MKNIVQKIIAAGVVVNKNKVLIIQRSPNDSFPNLWEIPSGKREQFEKTKEAVKREVKEETGLVIELIKPVDVFDFKVESEDEIRDATQISFLVKPVGKIAVKLSDEHQNFAWIAGDQIDEYNISKETKEVLKKALQLASTP